jgi:hypothetical protein
MNYLTYATASQRQADLRRSARHARRARRTRSHAHTQGRPVAADR